MNPSPRLGALRGVIVCMLLLSEGILPHSRADMVPEYRPRGKAALHVELIAACHNGSADEARSLLRRGANPNWTLPKEYSTHDMEDPSDGPAWLVAVRWAQLDVLRVLIEEQPELLTKHGGALVDETLSFRPWHGDAERFAAILKMLVEHKVEGHIKTTPKSRTLLMRAVAAAKVEFVRVLLAAGADANDKNAAGETALSIAKSEKKPTKEHAAIIKLLEPVTK